MDIKLNIPAHRFIKATEAYYKDRIIDYLSKYPFIVEVILQLKIVENDKVCMTMEVLPEKGKRLFGKHIESTEEKAFSKLIPKISKQLDKYKVVHYKKH